MMDNPETKKKILSIEKSVMYRGQIAVNVSGLRKTQGNSLVELLCGHLCEKN